MDFVTEQTYLSAILHKISEALLAPDIILLILFIGYALFCIGSILVELLTERRNFKVSMPELLADLIEASGDQVPSVIESSGMLNRQKVALLTVWDYRGLPGDALQALVRRLVSEEDNRLNHVVSRNSVAAKVAPMLGLMGTLIPLGPGIAALGQGDIQALSSSIVVAFDTTVAGLATAAVCLIVARIRRNWYEDYMGALESAMATMLEKIDEQRAAGKITETKPSDYAFIYRKSLRGSQASSAAKAQQKASAVAAQTSAQEVVKSGTSKAFAVAQE